MCPVIAWDLVSHGIPVLPQAPLQPSHDSSSPPRLRASPSASPRECFWDLGRVANGSATLPKSERCHIIPFRGSPSTFSGWWQKHTKTLASMLSSQRRQCSGLVLGCGWTEPTSDGLRKIEKMCASWYHLAKLHDFGVLQVPSLATPARCMATLKLLGWCFVSNLPCGFATPSILPEFSATCPQTYWIPAGHMGV